jgi:hypothetical protein
MAAAVSGLCWERLHWDRLALSMWHVVVLPESLQHTLQRKVVLATSTGRCVWQGGVCHCWAMHLFLQLRPSVICIRKRCSSIFNPACCSCFELQAAHSLLASSSSSSSHSAQW